MAPRTAKGGDIPVNFDRSLAARLGIAVPIGAVNSNGRVIAEQLGRTDAAFWSNTLTKEYKKCMDWINAMRKSDKSVTYTQLYTLCEILRTNLGSNKARSYAPPPPTAGGPGRSSQPSAATSIEGRIKSLKKSAEASRRPIIQALELCPLYIEGSDNTKAIIAKAIIAHCNSELRQKAYNLYGIHTGSGFASGTYTSNLSLGHATLFDDDGLTISDAEWQAGQDIPPPAIVPQAATVSAPAPASVAPPPTPSSDESARKKRKASGAPTSRKRAKTQANSQDDDQTTDEDEEDEEEKIGEDEANAEGNDAGSDADAMNAAIIPMDPRMASVNSPSSQEMNGEEGAESRVLGAAEGEPMGAMNGSEEDGAGKAGENVEAQEVELKVTVHQEDG